MWHSYLINLDENKHRMENSKRQFDAENIAFTRIDTVNGWQMDEALIAQSYDANLARRRYKYSMIRPEIGCYLSHIKAWQQITESGEKGGFVFEDDFTICSPLAPILTLLSSPNHGWDMIKLFSLNKNPKLCSTIIAGGNRSLKKEFSKKSITDQYLNLFSGHTVRHPL